MALVDLVMPKMGESIMEATILKWEKSVGDTIEANFLAQTLDNTPVSGEGMLTLYKVNYDVDNKPAVVEDGADLRVTVFDHMLNHDVRGWIQFIFPYQRQGHAQLKSILRIDRRRKCGSGEPG